MSKQKAEKVPMPTGSMGELLELGPSRVNAMIMASGQGSIDFRKEKFDVEEENKKRYKVLYCRGSIYRHKKRGTKVTIIDMNAKGEGYHRVIESKTGNEFIAKQSNLELIK